MNCLRQKVLKSFVLTLVVMLAIVLVGCVEQKEIEINISTDKATITKGEKINLMLKF